MVALEEIVVTARNRAEPVQDVPVAISAFSGRDLEDRHIGATDQLTHITPNLTFNSSGAFAGTKSVAQIFIRGMAQTDYLPVTDPGVAIYVDGIYMARSVGAVMELLDVERVEVLRGPQGTLFGRNAMGGAVSLHSRRPGEVPRRSVRATFGNDRMTNVTAVVSGGLAGRLSAGATVSYRHRDGYVTRIHDGLDLGDDNAQATRVSLVWRPRDGAELFATADYTRQRENGAPTVSGGVNDLMAFGTFGNALLDECTAVRINPDFPGDGPPSFRPPGNGAGGAERLLRAGQLRRGIPRRGELSRFRRSRFMGRKRRTDLDIGRVGHPEIARGLSGDAVVGIPGCRQHSRRLGRFIGDSIGLQSRTFTAQ